MQFTTPWNLTTEIIVAHIQIIQILKRRKSLRKRPIYKIMANIQQPQGLRQPYFSQIKSKQVVCQIYPLCVFLRPKQHRRITLQHVPGQVHNLHVRLPQRRRNLPDEAVAGE